MKTTLRTPYVKTRLALAVALAGLAQAATAVDYNDAYWANPNSNSDFVDQFTSNSINRTKWKVESNIFVNGEDQDYQDVEYPAADWTVRSGQDDAGAMDGKVLNLKARYMDGQIQDYYGGVPNQGKPLLIRAGRIESQITDESTFVYGKFEARIKMPPARNAEFPAWWLLGNFPDVGWTACQELDIIEFTGANPVKAPQTHWSAPYAIYGGNPNNTTYAQLGVNPSDQYVTYGVIKTPDSADFYINGVKTYSWNRSNIGEQQPWPYVSPMRMILNHAITHVEWPDVGNYNKLSADPNVANKTGWTTVQNGVTMYEYLDAAAMNANIGRAGTDFLVDYVAHWPLPASEPTQKYVDESKSSFFRATNNTKGFYSLKGWLAPVSVTGDAFLNDGPDAVRDNGIKNAADGYVGSKWATPKDDNMHSVTIDYGTDKNIKYFWIEWGWNLPKAYDIYGKTSGGSWELVRTSTQEATGWATHTFDVNKTYRYIKLVTKGRIDKSEPIWLLEFKAFEDVANVYPKPAGTPVMDRAINMLGNGTFTQNLAGWVGENFDGAGAAYASVNAEAKITAATQGANAGSYQLHTQGFGLKRNYRYQISFRARAEAARNIKLRLSEDTLNPSAQGTALLETVALGTGMNTYTYNVDYFGSDNPGRLSFLFGGMGNATTYIDDVVIKEIAYIGSADPLVPAINAVNFSGASSGWETDWWGVVQRAVDGATGNKASGQDGQSEGQDLWVSVKIDPYYEVKEVWVAGDKSAPRSLAQFKAEYGAENTPLLDWVNTNTDGVYESFSNFLAPAPVNTRDFRFWFRPPAGQLVEVADVQLMAIDHMPYRIYPLSLDAGGTISPSGVVRYSKSKTDSATYTFTPPQGGQVSNVIVDGVSLGALNSYTFNNVADNHTIAVSFSGGNGQPATSSSSSSSAPATSSSSSAANNGTLVSNGRPVTVSSQVQPGANAVDGNGGTRWESAIGSGPAWIAVDLGSAKPLNSVVIDWEAANAGKYAIQASNNLLSWTTLKTVTGGTFGNRTDTNAVSGSYRYVRIYATERSAGNQWGYSIWELKVYAQGASSSAASSVASSVATSAATSSVASSAVSSSSSSSNNQNAVVLPVVSATASTEMNPASLAIDNNPGTRWESTHGIDPSWLSLDLGAVKSLSSIEIDWEAANAATYILQGSNDNANWTDITTKTGGAFGNRTDVVALSGNYRYVRIYGTQRSAGNQWGYSIWEVRVKGN
jgi:hypothetical protein